MEDFTCGPIEVPDPDYISSSKTGGISINQQKILESKAREDAENKIKSIIENEFSKEMSEKKKEINKISKNLTKALKTLHYLRYAIVTDFYNKEKLFHPDRDPAKQSRIHPAVKNVLQVKTKDIDDEKTKSFHEFYDHYIKEKQKKSTGEKTDEKLLSEGCKKIPRYVAPKDSFPKDCTAPRGMGHKVRRKLIVGNISKWIPLDWREGEATHKWTLYVRDVENDAEIGEYLSKVRFFLHPSYKPNDVVEVIHPPFYLSRQGWGEFPARVQLHFKNNRNKPVDIIHNLKLDRTFTGLQTKGGETLFEVWIINENFRNPNIPKTGNSESSNSVINEHESSDISTECESETKSYSLGNDHNYFGENVINGKNLEKDNKIINYDNDSHESIQDCREEYHMEINKDLSDCNAEKNGKDVLIEKISYNTIKNIAASYNEHSSVEHNCIKLIENLKTKNISAVVKLLMGKLPLITKKATDPKYKIIHPYACQSFQEFKLSSIAKQRSIQWYRANIIYKVLKDVLQREEDIWTIKEIMLFGASYGFSPTIFQKLKNRLPSLEAQEINDNNITNWNSSSTICIPLIEWLNTCPLKSEKKDNKLNFKEEDMEIDIVGDENRESYKTMEVESNDVNNCLIFLDVPKEKKELQLHVVESARDIGIKLNVEEIIPGVVENTSSLLIATAVQCLMEDLIRHSYSAALKRSTNSSNLSITPLDVHSALLNQEEYDIFTNAGLGSQI